MFGFGLKSATLQSLEDSFAISQNTRPIVMGSMGAAEAGNYITVLVSRRGRQTRPIVMGSMGAAEAGNYITVPVSRRGRQTRPIVMGSMGAAEAGNYITVLVSRRGRQTRTCRGSRFIQIHIYEKLPFRLLLTFQNMAASYRKPMLFCGITNF